MKSPEHSLKRRSIALSGAFVVAGLLAYALMAVAKRSLNADEFSRFSVFWSFAFFLTASVGAPVEQELSRSVAFREAHGQRFGDVVREATSIIGLLVAGAIVVAIGAAASGQFRGLGAGAATVAGLVILLAGEALTSIVRGVLSGTRSTNALAFLVAGQSALRMLLVVVVVVIHPTSGLASLAVAVASLSCVAFVGVLRAGREPAHLGSERAAGLSRAGVVRLVSAAPFSAVFSVGTPALASVVASDADSAVIGDVLAALSLTSAPVLVAAALQSALLPSLVRTLVEGGDAALQRTTRAIIAVVLGFATMAALSAAAIGPTALRVLFGPTPGVGRWPLGAMTFAAGLLFLTNLLAPVCVARRTHGAVTKAWMIGAGALILLMLLLEGELAERVAISVLAGASVVVASLILSLRSVWRRDVSDGLGRLSADLRGDC